MEYRIDPKSGNKLSCLGFGCMRFPRNLAQIDYKKSENLVLKAVEEGINYFDTAYIYAGSEEVLGNIINNNNLRDKIFVATKLPLMKCTSYEDFDKLFYTQTKNLHTDHIDYYLMHNLSDMETWKKLCNLGIERWISEKKSSKEIRQIGFSFHGIQKEFMNLIDCFNWDFCQIQYNYVNANYQAGEAGLKKASGKGLPVIVMEPLLGGRLANGLPKKSINVFKEKNPNLTPAAWALKWLWNQKEVTVVLSGMNDIAQINENVMLSKNSNVKMTKDELETIDKAYAAFKESYKIPCTGCNYCTPCPKGVNIPGCFSAYNMSYTVGMFTAVQQYINSIGGFNPKKNNAPNNCIACGKCEKNCPQHIKIIDSLKITQKRMEPFWFKPARAVIGRIMR